MPHPVVPPQLPTIVEYRKADQFLSSAPVMQAESGMEKLGYSKNVNSSHILPSEAKALQKVKKSLCPESESVIPEFSNAETMDNTAVLGTHLEVGDSQAEAVIVQKTPDVGLKPTMPSCREVANSNNLDNLWFSKSPILIKTSALVKQPVQEQNYVNLQKLENKIHLFGKTEMAQNVPSLVPVQNIIEFKPRNLNNQPSTTTTVEFPPPNQGGGNTPQLRQRVVEVRVVEVIADRQEYDEKRRIVTAEGNVVVRFDGAVVDANRLQVNLDNLIVVGEGNVALTRGNQVLKGERFTYNFIQDRGNLQNGRGEIYVPTTQTDFAFSSPSRNITAGGVPSRPLVDRIRASQPVTGVSSPGGIDLSFIGQGDARNLPAANSGGMVKRLRFEAQRIDFYPRGWQAEDVRLTNDPFSPPELELRASKVTLTQEAPLVDRVTTQHQRLVFDQNFVLPIPIDNQKIDRRERDINPFIVSPGYDNGKRGGFYVERNFLAINNDQTRWIITPQLFVQKAIQDNSNIPGLFGVKTKLNTVLNAKTRVEGVGELTSLDVNKLEDSLRGSLRLRQTLGEVNPHTLNLEYSYRDRLYNGTLGFQTIQSSLGSVITSPIIPLGKSGINLTYQGGAQYINSNTDRQDLLKPQQKNNRVSLGRLQGSVSVNTGFFLWQGKPLAATPKEGLKYTSNPVVPYLQAIAGVTGTTSYYTSGDNQSTLIGTIGLVGQVGHFSRPFLDYTGFNISYSQGFNSGLSPFFFDRSVDNRVLSAGISQQIYGPFRLGFQTSINLDTGKESSTDYILEYNRRTYGIILRYNPVLELGGFSIRISDFNWKGGTDPFSSDEVKPVVGGVRQDN